MIRFSKYIWFYFLLSAWVLVPGIVSLVKFGVNPSIDFTGGTLMEVKFSKDIFPAKIIEVAKQDNIPLSTIQKSGTLTYILRIKPEDTDSLGKFQQDVSTALGQSPVIVRLETVGPILGKELLQKAFIAAILSIVAILAYVAYAFKNVKFGVCAVLALFHDLLVVLGSFSLLGHFFQVEVDTLFVTAFLTTMSFSVHDTIVVFDRIREYLKRGERMSFEELSDKALSETMGRSLTNSFTIIFMLLALVLLGGSTVRWFVIALLIGTVSGTYSSPFVATPLLIIWERLENRKKTGKH